MQKSDSVKKIQTTYLIVSFLTTFASSLIRGIDALFLLDAGLSTSQVFTVYSFMTLGTMLFEIPTGSIADVKGRRFSLLVGVIGLSLATAAYWFLWSTGAGFWSFAIITFGFGIAYTFSSGATEAWLVDALKSVGFEGPFDTIFARNQSVMGAAMLVGTLSGGLIAQATNLGVPYILRFILLAFTAVVIYSRVRDLGFKPKKDEKLTLAVRHSAVTAVKYGWSSVSIRSMMFAGLFLFASAGFIFYGMQPYLLQLYGNDSAYIVSALAAMIISASQMVGGVLAVPIRKGFKSRTKIMAFAIGLGALAIFAISIWQVLVATIILLAVWSMSLAVITPVRQAFMNAQIPSSQRASILSVDSLVSSAGSVPAQPILGRLASERGYPFAFAVSGVIQLCAIPFVLWSRKKCPPEADITNVNK